MSPGVNLEIFRGACEQGRQAEAGRTDRQAPAPKTRTRQNEIHRHSLPVTVTRSRCRRFTGAGSVEFKIKSFRKFESQGKG